MRVASRFPLTNQILFLLKPEVLIGNNTYMDMSSTIPINARFLFVIRQANVDAASLPNVNRSPFVRSRLFCMDINSRGVTRKSSSTLEYPELVLLAGLTGPHNCRGFAHLSFFHLFVAALRAISFRLL